MKYEHITQKKLELDACRPLPRELVTNLDDWFRVELTYTSNALEGNTLTRQETALVVEKGLTVGGKSLTEHLEATNHAAALDWVHTLIGRKPRTLNEKEILRIHSLILKGIDDANAGRYRTGPVRISGSTVVLPNHVKVPALMGKFIEWIQGSKRLHPVEFAAMVHYELVTIHPFVDGNGRTARLLMNLILMMQGYPPAIIRKRDRLPYLNALEKAQTGGPVDDYLKLIADAVNRSLDIYLKAAKGEDSTPEPESGKLLRIGIIARRGGEPVSTIRHWTKQGLLWISGTTPSGYQLYSADMLPRIRRIQELQRKRMTLEEIKQALD